MRTYLVTAYPYARVTGVIDVPDNVENSNDYIEQNFGEIDFGEPELDYCGTDYDVDLEA